jgi:integrase
MADTPDLGSGPARGGGSSPLSRTIFPSEADKFLISRTDSAQNPGGIDKSHTGTMRFPVKITYRKAEAKIYGKSAAYPFYRVCYYAAGKRHVRSFSTYNEAKTEADAKVREIANGTQTIALTDKEATAALSIRDALDAFKRDTGRSFTALEAVTGFLDAMKQLPPGCGLTESVRVFARTLAILKPKLISEAVEEFLAIRKPKSIAADGKRSQLSVCYTKHVECWMREFAAAFPGHPLGDLNREFLARYMAAQSGLSPKTRNDRRAAVAMFLRWCVRQDYLSPTHRLIEADAMQKEPLDAAAIDFYRPGELRALLEAADGPVRAIIALQGLAGLRLEETLRLTWANVFGIPGHVEITAQNAKTRRRRLVEICPALAAWLKPFRAMEGKVWDKTTDANGYVRAFVKLREPLKIPSRKNGMRHGFCTYHFALHSNENLTAAQAGNSPAMIHAHYKGLATKAEAEKWFKVKPAKIGGNLIVVPIAKLA